MQTNPSKHPTCRTSPRTPRAGKQSAVFAMAALVLSLCVPSFSAAHEAVIIKDADIKPYRDAVQGFKSSCGCTAKELELSDNNLAAKVEAEHPGVVFVVGTHAFRKVRSIRNVPIIYTMVMPSETAGAAADNIFGVSMDISPGSYFAAMAQLSPAGRRIGVLSDPEHTGAFVDDAAASARARGISLTVKTVNNPQEVPAVLKELLGKVDILWMLPDSTLVNAETVEYLMLFSFQNKLPVFSFAKKYVERGAVAALAIDPYDMGMQAGETALQLLQGEKVSLRAYARTSRLIVNTKVASKIGLPISSELIKKAERVE